MLFSKALVALALATLGSAVMVSFESAGITAAQECNTEAFFNDCLYYVDNFANGQLSGTECAVNSEYVADISCEIDNDNSQLATSLAQAKGWTMV